MCPVLAGSASSSRTSGAWRARADSRPADAGARPTIAFVCEKYYSASH